MQHKSPSFSLTGHTHHTDPKTHPELRVERKFPKTPIKSPHIWKKAKPNTVPYKLYRQEHITPEQIQTLTREIAILELSLTFPF